MPPEIDLEVEQLKSAIAVISRLAVSGRYPPEMVDELLLCDAGIVLPAEGRPQTEEEMQKRIIREMINQWDSGRDSKLLLKVKSLLNPETFEKAISVIPPGKIGLKATQQREEIRIRENND